MHCGELQQLIWRLQEGRDTAVCKARRVGTSYTLMSQRGTRKLVGKVVVVCVCVGTVGMTGR